ncbi:hypothetical protein E2636_01255 [Paenisporosarcina antarctica]|uniref:Nicotinate-nucleotide--dimethylbenzimidazole phosphoribosyltransferase n=1 Tax=Paenisporosarcina antarctica TaxID=417367 RepID=A0A4P7A2U6_9BACL|nr:hypothetical protein E2636_01255 [Paenisporosarcina antarctica]
MLEEVRFRKVLLVGENFREPLLCQHELYTLIQVGRELASQQISEGHRLLIAGEMGIGNTSASSALVTAIT